MRNRQIVVVSGKVCSGKTGLADLLEKEFQFYIIRTQNLLSELENEHLILHDQEPITSCKHIQDTNIDPRGMLQRINEILKSLDSRTSVVVDHLNGPAQVVQFRRQFGERLIHVHLYASEETLRTRYAEFKSKNDTPLSYDAINQLQDHNDILALKNDADVRIFTSRSDAKDTLARVASRLHLYASPEIRCVDVLIGGQYGSEGKGNVVSYLAREYDVIIRVGGPNAGHTVASSQGTYTYHHLPSGARDVNALLLLGPGMTIRLQGLLQEIRDCGINPDRLFIDPQATIIEDEDIETERKHLVSEIASTGSGSGAASARRILRRGKSGIRLAKDIPELIPYVGTEGNYRGTTANRLEDAYRQGRSILLEGTQGSALSIFHGTYPYVTSRDTNVAGCLAEAGISPSRVRKILMVVRPMPIRVGNPDNDNTSGPLKHETTFDEIANYAKLDAKVLHKVEKTSTTKRNRRVGWFEWEQFRKACALNAPTDIVLTFADYLNEKNRNARRFEQLDAETIKFIEELECVSQAPVSLINTRFAREIDETHDLRSVIDRRKWTARNSQ